MKTIMCFGDSNTWGSIPYDLGRYSKDERWASRMRRYLPEDWEVIEEGQPGRTTVHVDPFEDHRCGRTVLRPLLETHHPDLVLIMLGTNDLKHRFGLSADDISRGAARLVADVQLFTDNLQGKAPKVLLIAPPPTQKAIGKFEDMFVAAEEKSKLFDKHFSARAQELNCEYFNAGEFVESCPEEGIHWQVDQHANMAVAVAEKIRASLQ
jgi:lysophospholipase L1-like esterase